MPDPFRSAVLRGHVVRRDDCISASRELIGAFLAGWHLPIRTFAEVELALSEAVANIAEHAYPNRPRCPIAFEFRITPGRLEILLEDRGLPFRRRRPVRKPDWERLIEAEADGGFGRYAMSVAVDSIRYSRVGGVNRLVMIKRLARARR